MVALSHKWDRLHDDPIATGQRWYCSCEAKYKTKLGVLIGITDGGMAYYALADFLPQSFLDAKFKTVEERFNNKKTAKELLDALPEICPQAIGSVLTPTTKNGKYQLNRTMFKDMPKLQRFQLLSLANVKV